MRRTPLPWALLAIFLAAGGLACTADTGESVAEHASGEPELARYMMDLQHWSHKATLAVDARNAELTDFYLHELEETIEALQEEAPTYDGQPVGDLTGKMLVPSVEALDRALDEEAWPTVDERLQDMAHSCNQCHEATGYGFIRVDLQDVPNPYAQTFDSSRHP